MKIVLAADLHYGNLSDRDGIGPFLLQNHAAFADEMHFHKPDVLVVAGDVAETCMDESYLGECLDLYKNPHGASICIPGNHDAWLMEGSKMDHWRKHDWFFEKAAEHGWIGLRDKPWEKDGVWIAGGMGWYNFSSADPHWFRNAEEWDATRCWADYQRMRMDRALDVCEARMGEFDRCLSLVPPPDRRKALVVISHFVGFSRLMNDDIPSPDAGKAYMGNYSIGRKTVAAEADVFCCGHSHCRKEFVIGRTRCINNGSSYGLGSKRFDVLELG